MPSLSRPPLLRLAALALVLAGAVALLVAVDRSAGDAVDRTLSGLTDQGHELKLHFDADGRVVAVDARIDAVCRGGHPWSVTWGPHRGSEGSFRGGKARVVVREVQEGPTGDGRIQRVGVLLTGRRSGDRAGGEIRVVARFHRGGLEVQACDSGPQRWAVGSNAEARLESAPPPRRPTETYLPSAPSLAGPISAARKRFIRRTDATCVRTYLPAHLSYEAAKVGSNPEAQLALYGDYVERHADQVRALAAVGPPPDGAALHARWLDNMRTRVRLERRVLRLARARDWTGVRATLIRIARLKVAGNLAGQRFGLRVCTSNGPDRTPVPR